MQVTCAEGFEQMQRFRVVDFSQTLDSESSFISDMKHACQIRPCSDWNKLFRITNVGPWKKFNKSTKKSKENLQVDGFQ